MGICFYFFGYSPRNISAGSYGIGEGNGNPLQCSCLENPRDGGAWWAAVYGVTQGQTRLKWLSSSSMVTLGFPGGSVIKNLPANVRDTRDSGSISGSGRSPGGGNGNPLQYSCWKNPSKKRGAWWSIVHGVSIIISNPCLPFSKHFRARYCAEYFAYPTR